MIRLLREQELSDIFLMPAEWQMHRVQLLLKAYGLGYEFCRFYRQEESDAVVCVLEDSAIVWADNRSDFGELAACLQMSGVHEISAAGNNGKRLAEHLPDFILQNGLIMEKKADIVNASSQLWYAQTLQELEQGFRILSSSFSMGNFESWYCDMSHRIRHEAAKLCLWEQTGCAVLQQNGKRTFLSAVAVLPESRGKKSGSRMLKAIEAECAETLLGVYSRDENSSRFYSRLGFQDAGIWSRLCR